METSVMTGMSADAIENELNVKDLRLCMGIALVILTRKCKDRDRMETME